MTNRTHKTYEESLAEVETLVDGLGLGVDEGIRSTVAALRMLGFSTTGSCEGHADRALPYPWIDLGIERKNDPDRPASNPVVEQLSKTLRQAAVAAGDAKLYTTAVIGEPATRYTIHVTEEGSKWRQVKDLTDEAEVTTRAANLHQLERLIKLLDDFYASRKVPYAQMLTLERRGLYGSVRLRSNDAAATELKSETEKAARLPEYRNEMAALTSFLKAKAA